MFEHDLVGCDEDRFSHVEAHILMVIGRDKEILFAYKDLGQFPIQSAQILTACGEHNA